MPTSVKKKLEMFCPASTSEDLVFEGYQFLQYLVYNNSVYVQTCTSTYEMSEFPHLVIKICLFITLHQPQNKITFFIPNIALVKVSIHFSVLSSSIFIDLSYY